MKKWYNPRTGETRTTNITPKWHWKALVSYKQYDNLLEKGTIKPRKGTEMTEPIPRDTPIEEAYCESREILTELVLEMRLAVIEGLQVMNEQGEQEVILGVEQMKRKLIRAETFLGKQLSA